MLLKGKFSFYNEIVDFYSMISNGQINVYIKYNNFSLPAEYFFNNYFYIKRFYAFKVYYESQLFEDLKKVYDGNETCYFFKYLDSYISLKIPETIEEGTTVTKITKVFLTYQEQNEKYLILANLGNKTLKFDNNGKIYFVYDKLQALLGTYDTIEDIKQTFLMLGNYIDLKEELYIFGIIPANIDCMEVEENGSIYDFLNSGILQYTKNGFLDISNKNELIYDLEKKLGKVVNTDLIKQLIEY